MSDKKTKNVIPGVGCDVTGCKYNTVDCRCSTQSSESFHLQLFARLLLSCVRPALRGSESSDPRYGRIHITFASFY